MCEGQATSSFRWMVLTTTVLLAGLILQNQFTAVNSFDLNPTWFACNVEFKDKDAKIKAITDCATKTNYKLPTEDTFEALKAEMDRISSTDFEDACFSKCLYESFNMIKDGKINTDEFATFYKNSNISEPLLKEHTKLIMDCVKETEPKFKDAKEVSCKMFAMVDYCYFKKFEENKKKLEEICGKHSR